MPNKTIDMFTIRQILRLYASGKGTKTISQSTGVARNTVKKYLRKYVESRLTMSELDKRSDAQMSKFFWLRARNGMTVRLVPSARHTGSQVPLCGHPRRAGL